MDRRWTPSSGGWLTDLLDYIDAGGDGLKPFVVEGALLLKSGADPKGYYGPPQDAETRARTAALAAPTKP